MVTEFRLDSQTLKQTLLEMPKGHYVNPLTTHVMVCTPIEGPKMVVLDPDHQVIASFETADDFYFGGHSAEIVEMGVFAVSIRSATGDKPGYLGIYDNKTLKELSRVSIAGKFPHDMKSVPGQPTQIAISHGLHQQDVLPEEVENDDPVASIMDLKTGEIVRTFKPVFK